ncbi:MAG: MMPL family transporter [Ketobacter sp.]|nr:MMPL family transporter [Ketobacter sp.]
MANWLIEKVVRWRYGMIVVSLIVAVVFGWGAQYLQPDTDYKAFFKETNPQLMAFNRIGNAYTQTDSVLFVVQATEATVFTPETLLIISELTRRAWELPYSQRVDSVVNFQHTDADDDGLVVRELVEDAVNLTSQQADSIRQIALNEPQLVKKLISADGKVAGVNVVINLPVHQGDSLHEVGEAARALRAEFADRYPDVRVLLSGIVEYNYASEKIIGDEMVTLMPFMLLVVLLVLVLMLRSFWGTFATLVVILFSIAVAMGAMGWIGWPLTSGSAGAPTIVLTMAVADCVHILVTYYLYLRQGQDKFSAMRTSLRLNFQPVFITSLTTAIGFLSMNYSDLPPFNVLGNVVAIGVVAAFLFAIFFLPALMLVLPARVGNSEVRQSHAIDPFANFVVRHRTGLLWGVSVITIALIACIPRNDINDNFLRFIKQGNPTRDSTDFISENLSSFYSVEYSLHSPYEGGVYDPRFLQQVHQFSEWLKLQPEVAQVMSITDIFTRLNRNMHGNDPAWEKLPQERELAAQYLLLYEMSLPFGLDLNNQINFEKTATRLTVNLVEQNTAAMLRYEKKYADYLRVHAPDIRFDAGSTTLLFSHAGISNAISMLEGSILALIIISIILIVALRSLKIGLISIIPNLIPAGLAFGLWAIFVGEVGISIAIAIGMTLGIVVDNTVHFLSKYLRVRREQGATPEQAVRYSFSNVGVALLATNIVLIAGFLVLSMSGFVLNSQMGMFTALTFVMALLVDFFYLPVLLLLVDKDTKLDADHLHQVTGS